MGPQMLRVKITLLGEVKEELPGPAAAMTSEQKCVLVAASAAPEQWSGPSER